MYLSYYQKKTQKRIRQPWRVLYFLYKVPSHQWPIIKQISPWNSRMFLKILYHLISFNLFFFITSSNVLAFESHWPDYREPLVKSMKTCLEGEDHFVSVNLPANFLNNHDTILLSLEFESKTYSKWKNGDDRRGFYGYSPFVQINDSFFSGFYQVSIPESPASQTYLLKIKSADFTPGNNTIKLGFGYDTGGTTNCKCCRCIFKKLEFSQAEMPLLKVTLNSSPQGASAYINNTHKGKTPLTLHLREKGYWLKIEKDGYDKLYEKIYVAQGKTSFNYDMTSNSKMVSVKTNVDKVKVYLDGKFIGHTPLSANLDTKSHQFEFKKKGYIAKKKTIQINSSTNTVSVDLKKIRHLLVIETDKPDATVFINGKLKGSTPLSIEVDTGKLNIKIAKPDYETIDSVETINQGKILKFILTANRRIPASVLPIKVIPQKKSIVKVHDDLSKFGKYYGLIVGNNKYNHLEDLKTATNDANIFAKVLEDHYGFSNKILINASREEILLAFQYYRETLTENDNLLIYFAGHGWLDQLEEEGYWLPIDAAENNKVNWVSNSSITATLRALQARHILIIADSCYSGTLTRGIKPVSLNNPAYRDRVIKRKSRSAITSGGIEPVSDAGIFPDHSVFAQALIDLLQENTDILGSTHLFRQIRRPVRLNSDQTPEFSDIKKAGHNGGEFFFIRQ